MQVHCPPLHPRVDMVRSNLSLEPGKDQPAHVDCEADRRIHGRQDFREARLLRGVSRQRMLRGELESFQWTGV
jgi:hypothetical protein